MIIGTIGFIGSGKGTVGDILVSDHNFQKVAFADALKDAVSVIFGWPRDLLEGDTDESRKFRETFDTFWSDRLEDDITPRYVLQKFGTEAARNSFHDKIWIYALEKRLANIKSNIVVSDVRFPNEIDFIRSIGGKIVWVKRGSLPEWYDTAYNHNHGEEYLMYKKYPNVHLSEWAWIGCKYDYHIENNHTLFELKQKTKNMLHSFENHVRVVA
jgi:hypothetical protein